MVLASQTFAVILSLFLVLLATYYAGIINWYLQTQIEDLVHFPTTPSTAAKLLLVIAHCACPIQENISTLKMNLSLVNTEER